MKCVSGKHEWLDQECARRCCNGYHRIMGLARGELERIGAEHIRMRGGDNLGIYDGWIKEQTNENY